ncbi:hypothetical protein SEVIR_5G421900v4 [Setaria viridis]|uniref:DUF1618 domain-containing protein n=1 Tax=Setaria viridis TaxID=4556 RepID=A0A4U6URI2_SETVI|nr:uncharacterized protein LOC117859189 [Setaria viridis]TKW18292.1 hypothetical protein SEVIR_5G421900v2 [Setaria viridis]
MATATPVPASCALEEVLLDGYAYIGNKPNHTTAVSLTRNTEIIVASFWSERPPLPSRLYVHCPELESSAFSQLPRILCVVEGLILFRVAIRCREPILYEECDYFIYHVDSRSLKEIPNPSPFSIRDDDMGLLPRGNHYTVAALVPTSDDKVFTLHLFQSEIRRWTSKDVSLEAPQSEFPIEIPRDTDACRLLSHTTSTVITLGGEDGTMGWVDLWRGILLCDVLLPAPKLRGVPLPWPRAMYLPNGESRINFGSPKLYRGIAFSKEKRCLRFVDLDTIFKRLPASDKERGIPTYRFEGWEITKWSNCNLTNSFEDWKADYLPIHANDIKLNEQMQKQMLEYQLLWPKAPSQGNSVAADPGRNLENVTVFLPTPSMDDSNVVFLIAKAEFRQPKAYVLEVDMGNRQLKGVTEFGTAREPCARVICCHGSVSQV